MICPVPFPVLRCVAALAVSVFVVGCGPKKAPPQPEPTGRCEVDLASLELFSTVGSTATAKKIASADELIGGPEAQGAVGDFLLQNDRVRVIVGGPSRAATPSPYGGAMIDADLKRPVGQAGRDRFSKLGLFYGFGRTARVEKVEVLKDGSTGGYAVIAATGTDELNDTVNLPRVAADYFGAGAQLAVDPEGPLPLLITTYYVLSPGENRVRALTAFCNTGTKDVVTVAGDLYERSASADFFNPQGCATGFGGLTCPINSTPWVGYQGEEVAYALRAYSIASSGVPEMMSVFSVRGSLVVMPTGPDAKGLLPWTEASATRRPGEFGIKPAESRHYLRDLVIARDLGTITSSFIGWDASAHARLNVTVTFADGTPAPSARVAVIGADGKQRSLLFTDESGKARADLAPGSYTLRTGKVGCALAAPTPVTIPSTGEASAQLTLGASQKLAVTIADPSNQPLPGKVVVLCPQGACSVSDEQYRPFFDVEPRPAGVAAMGYAGADGRLELQVPPGQYEVLVTHGPEYSAWPSTFPAAGQPVDVTVGAASVQATLARVVDSTGWQSTDLDLHSTASPGGAVSASARARGAAAEGLDVITGTDHGWMTPYQSLAAAQTGLGAAAAYKLARFESGHVTAFNVSPMTETGVDWAGSEQPTLRLDQLFSAVVAKDSGVALVLSPVRGPWGALTQLKVDTATGKSRATAAQLRAAEAPAATADDTKQFSDDFDAMVVSDGAALSLSALNDWMTFLSRGRVKTAVAGSGSFSEFATAIGYGRTWVELADSTSTSKSDGFAVALKAHRAVASNGPFIQFKAQRLDASSMPVGEAVASGGLLSVHSAQGETVRLTVDVQAPEWMTFDLIEIYSHAAGREAVAGVANDTWPADRIHQRRELDATELPIETLPAQNGVTPKRIRVVETFTVSPTADTWYTAIVRSTGASRSLAPLVWGGVQCAGGMCTAQEVRPWAVANAVLIDADESGAYDHFPLP